MPSVKYHQTLFWAGLSLLLVPGIVLAYLLMPYFHSQELDAIRPAYYLHLFLWPTRIAGALLLFFPLLRNFAEGNSTTRLISLAALAAIAGVLYINEYAANAERLFKPPERIDFATAAGSKVPADTSVIGISDGKNSKAYPIGILALYHNLKDSLGEKPILVTYCLMCRAGRVYSPVLNGEYLTFRLVGASHYNSVLEDDKTGSWWYQESGEAAVGKLAGAELDEVFSKQMALGVWLKMHPESLILQPDPSRFGADDRWQHVADSAFSGKSAGKIASKWTPGSWVLGIEDLEHAKAYPWQEVIDEKIVNDAISNVPIVIMVENDGRSFHAWKRTSTAGVLDFEPDSQNARMTDRQTGSLWNNKGECYDGAHKGMKLEQVAAYQEYWRSWRTFHPETEQWSKDKKPD